MKISLKTIYFGSALTILFLGAEIANVYGSSYNYTNPVQVTSLTSWITGVLAGLQEIVGILAIIMIVVAGIIYIFSGVNSSWMTTAKNMATWSLVGFAIAIAAPSLLKEIVTVFGANPSASSEIINDAVPLREVLLRTLSFLLTIIGILALISFAIGGFKYLTSVGDSGKAENAKRIFFYSTAAVLVSGSGVIIIRQILKLLEG